MTEPCDLATVHLLDDDPAVVSSLLRLLGAAGHRVESHQDADAFFAALDPGEPGCLVLDLAMPGANGHEVQDRLSEDGSCMPVIFLSGQGDISASVRAMKGGAVDFLTKPVRAEVLLAAIDQAIAREAELRLERAASEAVEDRLTKLTAREREVLDAVVSGRLNKQIADDLGIVEKTVKVHRARVMRKMGVRTLAELVALVVSHEHREMNSKRRP
jgi:FixJ family two-component response regulator